MNHKTKLNSLHNLAVVGGILLSVGTAAAREDAPAPSPDGNAPANSSKNRYGELKSSKEPLESIDKFLHDDLGLEIRKSVTDQTITDQPAQVQYVSPRGASSSYSIDVGASMKPSFLRLQNEVNQEYLSAGPMLEYHKQTQISKPLENFQAGADSKWTFGNQWFGGVVEGDPVYNLNHQKTGNGFLGTASLAPTTQLLLMGYTVGPKFLDIGFVWQPRVAVQYQTSDNVLKSKESGDAFRGKIDLSAAIYPAWAWQGKHKLLIAFTGDWTYWADANQDGGYKRFSSDDRLIAGGIQLAYKGASTISPGLKLEYSRGSNPETGLGKQEQVTLSFTLKL